MRDDTQIKNVMELFNTANQDESREATAVEAIYDTLRWVFYQDTPDHIITSWLPNEPTGTTPIPGTDPPSESDAGTPPADGE